MRLFALRAVLMLALAILAVSALSAGMSIGVSGTDATYMAIVTTTSAILVAVAMWLTRGMTDAGAGAEAGAEAEEGPRRGA